MSIRIWSQAILATVLLMAPAASGDGGRVLAEIDCPASEPMGMVSHDGALWISDMAAREILKVQPTDGSVLEKIAASGLMPTGLCWHDDVLYSADRRRDRIARRRPGSEADLSPIPYYERWATGIAHDGKSLWVVDSRARKLHKVDPIDGTTVESFPAPAKAPTGLAFDGQYLWTADHGTDEIYRIDPRDGSVVTVLSAPGPYPSALAVQEGSLWIADYQTRKLYRVELPGETPYVEDRARRVRVSYSVTYRVNGPGTVEELTVFLALPREIPGQHLLSELTFEPEPARYETDRWGQKVAVMELGRLASGETKVVNWGGDFALYRTRFHILPEVVDSGELPAGMEAYLHDDRKYDLESEVIGELVTKLTSSEVGTYRKARSIYEHLAEIITYERSSGWNNAATVLERGTGSCSEYTFALVALLRRAGIPARYVGAISERGDEASFDDVFHRWAEAYLPGYGWVPVDANAAHDELPGVRGSFFGGRSNRHVVTTIGGGASEYLEWTYNSHETYQTVGAAELEVRPIARYRPLEGGPEAEPHDAPRVIAPRLIDGSGDTATSTSNGGAPYWTIALVAVLGVLLGIGLGRQRRRGTVPPKDK